MVHLRSIFWTCVVWIFSLLLFYGYTRVFDASLVDKMYGDRLGTDVQQEAVACTGGDANLADLQEAIIALEGKIDGLQAAAPQANQDLDKEEVLPPTDRAINLYYFNETVDSALPTSQQGTEVSLQPIARVIDIEGKSQKQQVRTAIKMLIAGELTSLEKAQGFTSPYPVEEFELVDVDLDHGILGLEFTEVEGFTSGGSARVALLKEAILKTAAQFEEVAEVVILPETIFQP